MVRGWRHAGEFDIDSCGTGGGSPDWYLPGGFSYHEGALLARASTVQSLIVHEPLLSFRFRTRKGALLPCPLLVFRRAMQPVLSFSQINHLLIMTFILGGRAEGRGVVPDVVSTAMYMWQACRGGRGRTHDGGGAQAGGHPDEPVPATAAGRPRAV